MSLGQRQRRIRTGELPYPSPGLPEPTPPYPLERHLPVNASDTRSSMSRRVERSISNGHGGYRKFSESTCYFPKPQANMEVDSRRGWMYATIYRTEFSEILDRRWISAFYINKSMSQENYKICIALIYIFFSTKDITISFVQNLCISRYSKNLRE